MSPNGHDGQAKWATATRRKVIGSIGALGVAGVAGCTSSGTEDEAPSSGTDDESPGGGTESTNTVEDATGRTVTVPSTVEDVVAVGPGMLNLVAMLDAVEMVAGVEKPEHTWARDIPYNIANPELRERQVIGPHKGGDAELIAEADPDVVVATYFTAGTANQLQGKIDCPVVVIKADSRPLHRLDGAYEDLRFLADMLGRSDRAEAVVEFFESRREDLRQRSEGVSQARRPVAYYAGRSSEGGAGATSTQHPFAPFAFVGADNAADAIEGHKTVSEEELLRWDPDVVFVAGSNRDRVLKAFDSGKYATLSAVESGDLYGLLPTRFYGNLYGNTLADAYYVGSVLYPDAFSDVDPIEQANEIHRTLFGTAVYDQLAEQFGGFEQLTV
ncbi:ABC-type Fe3+-hydroxamate transport system, periplasmic component [Halapricum desulfuricans]|uniref:ABC-type Fe3+-hydroxamate transport system, periplasmic component n=1 Tax=Halapricum desulfuricans TaxID=2841257 RepID=A0A897NJW2_9EURY|nr:ABC transporter substrate-binding protein [Halapricum desulfuricans]QSG11243.1 ABC-type Fe3+-hydroxamate transport system, periplasmic component [Halapricum desulfuricans]